MERWFAIIAVACFAVIIVVAITLPTERRKPRLTAPFAIQTKDKTIYLFAVEERND